MNAPPDTPPQQHKPVTISSFLLSCLMTGSIIAGAIGTLAVIFLADGIFNVGPDPAIQENQVTAQIVQTNQRVAALEKQAQEQQATPAVTATTPDLSELQKTVATNTEQTQALQQKVDTISTSNDQGNKAAQIALGLTQVKNAFENDLPLQTGIDTLKKSVSNEAIQKDLNDLAATTEKNFPTKRDLLTDIDQMKASLAPAPVDPSKLTWDQRAKYELGQFVQVQPKQTAQTRAALDQAANFIRNNNFTAALEEVKQIPASAQQELFYKQIELRVQAESMIDNVINGVTQKIDAAAGQGGSLY